MAVDRTDGSSHAAGRASIVLYDGGCRMCTSAMATASRRQALGSLRWVDNASPEGQALLDLHGLREVAGDSVIVLDGGRISTESDAAVQVALRLRWPWKAMGALRLLPRPLRDLVYRQVARRRDRSCRVRRVP